ncbi:glyoxylase I family protein [Anoxybacillus tepidamans]|uniref:Glyoxylase I family protein n=1 Tax=Anoxybacteroides tepidamans TaxID=265948 RepID=A0A7W8IQV3_9BACL|nr:VOC family protein [Anoxybacillus tepidamans]MBB5324172.1 glyoxylase I family protein [Anoxybacillus tepidamans]
MHFSRLHHIAIICSNYERSKHFYTNVLGFRILHEQYRSERKSYKLDLQAGDVQIELFSFEQPPKRQSEPEACGLRHLAFAVENIDAAIAYLESYNIAVEPIRLDPITGKRFTFFRDPDDLPLELYET